MFFEREVQIFGMSMSTGREMMAWYIRVVLILCEVGQLQVGTVHFFSIPYSLFFSHIVISDRTKVGRCMDMDLPVISRPFSVIH